MDYDEDKIDDHTLALLYLVTHERREGLGARAWKGLDWDTMNRLHEKGYISNPASKAKSVAMTEEGFLRAKEQFKQFFAKQAVVVSLPKLTPDARKRWNEVSERSRKDIIESVWCPHCQTGVPMQLRDGKMERRLLVLRGTCKKCGGEVARVVEPEG
jgi:hypothetical protein